MIAAWATVFLGQEPIQAQVVEAPEARPGASAEASAAEQNLAREVLDLQQRLQAINLEVKALKQGPSNLSTQYRLRQKLADAESLGRRLTEAEARLRAQQGTVEGAAVTNSVPSPRATATDGPVELAAKADILLDQAQKLVAQADKLEQRVAREQQRNTLRARASHLEQDPFVGLESSKRNIAFARSPAPVFAQPDRNAAGASDKGSESADADAPLLGPSAAPVSAGRGEEGTAAPNVPVSVAPSPEVFGSASVGARAMLDAGVLAQIARLESSGDPRARSKALEAVVAALRKQARELQSKAAALRSQR